MLSEFSGSPPSIRITEPATPIPVTGWTPFLDHGFLGPFDSGPSKAFRQYQEARKALEPTSYPRLQDFLVESIEPISQATGDGMVEILVSVEFTTLDDG